MQLLIVYLNGDTESEDTAEWTPPLLPKTSYPCAAPKSSHLCKAVETLQAVGALLVSTQVVAKAY